MGFDEEGNVKSQNGNKVRKMTEEVRRSEVHGWAEGL